MVLKLHHNRDPAIRIVHHLRSDVLQNQVRKKARERICKLLNRWQLKWLTSCQLMNETQCISRTKFYCIQHYILHPVFLNSGLIAPINFYQISAKVSNQITLYLGLNLFTTVIGIELISFIRPTKARLGLNQPIVSPYCESRKF